MEDGEDEKCKDKSGKLAVNDSGGGCGKLSYLTDNQIHMRRVRRRNQLSCTKEIATATSHETLEEENLVPVVTEGFNIADGPNTVVAVDSENLNYTAADTAQDPVTILEVEAEIQHISLEPENEPSTAVPPLATSPDVHDPDNNPVDYYRIPDKLKCLNFKLTSPAKLEPIFLQHNDVRNLLDFAREKGLSTAPRWQRQGITRINQFLINLNPISKPLTRLAFQLHVKTENTLGSAQRLIFFYFWFTGLTIQGLGCKSMTGPDLGFLIYQLRTPIRRIYKLNSLVRGTLESPVKKLRAWIQPMAKELDEEVYNYLLRLTPPPPPPTAALEIPQTDDILEALDLDMVGGRFKPKRPNLILTSISTVLLMSYEGRAEVGNLKVSSLPIRGGIFVIQGILGAIEKIVQEMMAAASEFKILVGNEYGKVFRSSTRELVKELKEMRTDRGLRHVTATRNLANSIKNLQVEMVQLEKTFEDVECGVSWIEDALELCLRQAENWTSDGWEKKLRLKKNRRTFLDCFKGQPELSQLQTFDEFFGTEDFGQISDSFQIRIPIRNDRMKFLFPDPTEEEVVKPEVKDEPTQREFSTIVPDDESVKIESPILRIQSSESTICTAETVDTEFDHLPPLIVSC